MKKFEYVEAGSIEEVLAHLNGDWNTRIIAGGTDLLHEMKNDIIAPTRIIDIKGVDGLRSVIEKDGSLVIGSLVTLDEIEQNDIILARLPILKLAVSEAASPQLRNMATLVGNICQRPRCWYYRNPEFPCLRKGGKRCFAVSGENAYHAIFGGGPCHIVCPSDAAPALVALGASVVIRSSTGAGREVLLEDFFVGPRVDPHRENTLKPDEFIVEIHVPLRSDPARGVFLKARERKVWDFALASVAAVVVCDGNTIEDANIVLGRVSPNPWRTSEAEDVLHGAEIDEALAGQAARAAIRGATPMRDNRHKSELAKNLIMEALRTIFG